MGILLHDGFLENCAKRGEHFISRLLALKHKHPVIKDVRGKGLIMALELEGEATPLVARCMERGILINCTNERVLRFIPPLTITEEEIDTLVGTLDELLRKLA